MTKASKNTNILKDLKQKRLMYKHFSYIEL